MVFFLALMVMLFAGSFTLVKVGLLYADPFFFIGVRSFLAGLIFVSYLWFTNKEKLRIQKQDVLLFIQVMFFGFLLSGTLYMWGMQYLSSGKGAFLYNLMPFIMAILSYFYLQEKMTWRKWLAIGIGFLGSIPLLLEADVSAVTEEWVFSWPTLMSLIAVISYCFGMITIRKLVKKRGYAPPVVVGVCLLVAGIIELIISLFVEGLFPVTRFLPFILIVGVLVLSFDLLYNFLYASLLKKFTATFLALVLLVAPLISSFIGWLFLKEKLSFTFFPAITLALVGLIIFYREERKLEQEARRGIKAWFAWMR